MVREVKESTRHSADTQGRRPGAKQEAGLLGSSFTFLRVKGIPIGAHWSWLFVFALVLWTLALRLFPATYPDLGGTTYWIMGAVAAVAFFGSVLLHELGHALTARREGMPIDGITLWLFGGVARFSSAFRSPKAEAKIALAGPAVTVVLALVFGVLAWFGNRANASLAFVGVVDYLARINLIVLAFNLVPALPLDGGRVLRAWLWHRQENFVAATRSAALAGRAFGMMLIGIGLLGFFTGASTGGLWMAFIGWFLLQASEAEVRDAVIRQLFRGVRVRDLMTPDPVAVNPHLTVQELFELASGPRGHAVYPVVDGGRVAGAVSVRRAAGLPRGEQTRSVADVMIPLEEVPTVAPDQDVMAALEEIQGGLGRLVVTEGDSLVGILSLRDVIRSMELRQLRGATDQPVKRAGLWVWAVVVLALLLAGAALYRPPLVVMAPGPAVDVAQDIEISGAETDEMNGRYLLTSVALTRPSALGALYAQLHPDRELLPLRSLIPAGVDADQYLDQQLEVFEESQQLAAAAAAQQVGLPVTIEGSGAQVLDVVPGAPADDVLRPEDVIVSVDGRPVRLASDVVEEVRSRPAGSQISFTVERDGEREQVVLRSRILREQGEGVVGIGALLTTRDFSIDLPFEVDFAGRDIGGPSAGLAYALAITDLLDPRDLAEGRSVAATGTIGVNGRVGPVGGIEQKAAAADRRGASLMLVPAGSGLDSEPDGISVHSVGNLSEAVTILEAGP